MVNRGKLNEHSAESHSQSNINLSFVKCSCKLCLYKDAQVRVGFNKVYYCIFERLFFLW